jgi:hypothetical protein
VTHRVDVALMGGDGVNETTPATADQAMVLRRAGALQTSVKH